MKLLVVGASRGLGLAFVQQYVAAGDSVIATVRDAAAAQRVADLGAQALTLDVTDTVAVSGLIRSLGRATLDLVIVNAGVAGPRAAPLVPPSQDDFDAVMRTNVLGPMAVIAAVADALVPQARLVVLSSRMGSIGERANAGSGLYRASKAAVNSVVRDASIALAGRAVCVALHPGWVRTEMGGAGADLSIDESVQSMRQVVARLVPADTGRFLNYDGQSIAW